MTKSEQYGLSFCKSVDSDGGIRYWIKKDIVDNYSYLHIIGYLDSHETKCLIDEISQAINGEYYEQYFTSDSIEAEDIELVYPDIIINGSIIKMEELSVLLNEWLSFITQTTYHNIYAALRRKIRIRKT